MKAHPKRVEKASLSQLKSEARGLCRDLAFETAPVGFGGRARRGVAAAIERDVRRMFPVNELSVANGSRIYALVRETFDEEVADAFWYYYKRRDYQRAGRIMRRRGIPRSVDEAAYARALKNGRRLDDPPIALGSESRIASLIRKRQKRIGMAKAGWYQAARGVGGRDV